MLLQWGTESNESTSSECCASLIIFYLTSPSCSWTKKYKVHARHLWITGESVQSDANGNISDNKFFKCYVPADGPNTTTALRVQCIWGMLLMFLRIILTLCRWNCRAIPILSCPPLNLIFSSKCHSNSSPTPTISGRRVWCNANTSFLSQKICCLCVADDNLSSYMLLMTPKWDISIKYNVPRPGCTSFFLFFSFPSLSPSFTLTGGFLVCFGICLASF